MNPAELRAPPVLPAEEAAPPPRSRASGTGLVAALLGLGLGLAWVAGHEPAGQLYYPRCTFYAVTGWQCPGCGATRALYALLHGDLAAAWSFNPLLFVVAGAAAWAVAGRLRAPAGRVSRRPVTPAAVLLAGAGLIAFTIGRNL